MLETNHQMLGYIDSQKEYWIDLGIKHLDSIEVRGALWEELINNLTTKISETYEVVVGDAFRRSLEMSSDYDNWLFVVGYLLN